MVHDSDNRCELWNKRMGHLNYKSFSVLKDIATILLYFSDELQGMHRGCALGKNAKDTFPSRKCRSKGILDLIHLYVCGLMSVESMYVTLYYVMFIDDFCRKT